MIYHPSEIKAAREKLGWSQHDLATKSGVHSVMISRFESGRNARSDILQKLTDALRAGGAE